MFIYSVKAQTIKLYISIIASVLAVVFVAILIPFQSNPEFEAVGAGQEISRPDKKDYKDIKTNEERIRFLEKFGWKVDENAIDVCEVMIPVKFDPIYEKYNRIQLNEGLDLGRYKGKTVKKYTYLVNNYEYDGTVYANLLIYKNRVIGGDITSAVANGFLHGLSKESDSLT